MHLASGACELKHPGTFIRPQVRAGLAQMGYRSLDEVVGRADLLKQVRLRLQMPGQGWPGLYLCG